MEYAFELAKTVVFWYIVLVAFVTIIRVFVHGVYKGVWIVKRWPESFHMDTPEANFYWTMYHLGEFVSKVLFIVCLPLLALLAFAWLPAGIRWLYHRPFVARQSEKLEQLIRDGHIDAVGTNAYHPYGESAHIIVSWGIRGSYQGAKYAFAPAEFDSEEMKVGEVPAVVKEVVHSEYVIEIINRTAKRMAKTTMSGIVAYYGKKRLKKGAEEKVGHIERVAAKAA